MTATRTLAKSERFFEKKRSRREKKLKTRLLRANAEKRVFSEHSGEDRSGFAPDSLLRESCDPPPASSKSRRSRFRTRKTRRGKRRRRRSKTNRPTGGGGRSKERERTSLLLSLLTEICQRGGDGAAAVEKGRLLKNRRRRNAIRDIFEFRGKFVLLDFVVHRFLANAEFTRGETTATVASDERFEESEPFDLRQRQSGETERRRRRNVGATGRAERNGERTRRVGRRQRNVGDRNAGFAVSRVARKTVDGTRGSDRKVGVGASSGRRVCVGMSGGESVASKRRRGGRGILA